MSQQIQNQTGMNTRQVCHRLALPYSTLLRWRSRDRNGLPLLARPGPKKRGALPFEEVRREVEALQHRAKRTHGTGALYQKHRESISRRDLAQIIAEERKKQKQARAQNCKRITWKEPNLAWAIDATEYGRDRAGRKLYIVATQDIASQYAFEPLVTLDCCGEEVAAHLKKLCRQHGPPLFLKRDNGGPFNHQAVNALLASECIIPLNSPAYYAPYNGAIEKGIREFKEKLSACLHSNPDQWKPAQLAPLTNAVANLRNCKPRSSLGGHSAAETFYHQPRSRFGIRKRHITFEWIKSYSNANLQRTERFDRRSLNAAWRHAAETWLRCQGLISLSLNGKVLPHLPLHFCS